MRFTACMMLLSAAAFAQIDDSVRAAMMRRMDTDAPHYAALSKQIWEYAEVGYQETKSSAAIAAELRQAGFRVETGVANMPTSIVASTGAGKPVIAIIGEYDALPGLSQKPVPERDPVVAGANGHGCGHNLFGTAAAHAAIAVKRAMEERKIQGTLRFYGTPAEEGGGGKIHMIRAGLFKDVDAAITWHPWDYNAASTQNWLANIAGHFHFTGKAAHAAAAPDAGRSALDAAMIMTHAIDLMREHVPQETRMHYILEKAGSAVNIVPDNTEVVMMARHPNKDVLAGIWERILNCAQAGALATGTQMNFEITSSYANMLSNSTLISVIDRNLRKVGGFPYTAEEKAFADKLATTLTSPGPADWHEGIRPIQGGLFSASTDVGDLSYNVPTAQFMAAAWVPGTAAHSWQSTAASGMTIGQKALGVAAKTLALTALDLMTDPGTLQAAKNEFQKATAGKVYSSLHPTAVRPR